MNASEISDHKLAGLSSFAWSQGVEADVSGRSVCIVPLSESIPSKVICSTFSATLGVETRQKVLLVQIGPRASLNSTAVWKDAGVQGGAEFKLARYIETVEQSYMRMRLDFSDSPRDQEVVTDVIQHCTRFFDYVVIDVCCDLPLPLVTKCIENADVCYLLGRPTASDFFQRDFLYQHVHCNQRNESMLRTIVCREGVEATENQFVRDNGEKIDGAIHGCSSALRSTPATLNSCCQVDIRRLVREVSRRRVGLALSSGGARGLAHIGVIQVLEENGIEIDVIAGCSMGSYVGAVWAYGYDGSQMERLAREVEHRWGLLELIDPFLLPRQGFLRGEKVKRRLKRTIGDVHFSELRRPLRIVATHLSTLGRMVFSTGEVAQAVLASSAIPGACVPVAVGPELFIDGGVADPLPVDVLREMGIERIIAVNTIPTPEYLRSRLEMERERNQRLGRRANKVKSFINRYVNYFAPGNVLDIILRSFNGAQMQVAEHSCGSADLVLRPLLFDGRWHDFRRPGKYIAVGRRETERHLGAINCLVRGKNRTNEPQTDPREMGTPA